MKRIMIALMLTLTYVAAVGLFPMTAFAAPENGDICTTDYVNTLVGSDGEHYYRMGLQTSIKYNSDGSTDSFSHVNYDGPREHYLIKPDDQGNYYGYCIEQGVSYPDAQRYTGVDWKKDRYFSNLTETAQTGIMLATIFGRQPGKSVPVAGCNDDDWYWATQVIIWEYQQKLRFSPTKIQGNGYVSANYFQSTLDGRPAEKCYNYMLNAMAKYQEIPSFASNSYKDAPLHVLKWDSTKSQWCLILKDANKTGQSLITDSPKITLQKSGNDYTFYSTSKLALETIEFKKDFALPSHELLIWGSSSGSQAISTGTADPIHFFVGFRTEQPGTFVLHKRSEDNNIEGFEFKMTNQNGQIANFKTNAEGAINALLFPGKYLVSETPTQKYRTLKEQTVEIKENEVTTLEVTNMLKKGQIKIQKNLKDTISNRFQGEVGAVFQIFPAQYQDFDGSPENLRDTLTTDRDGFAISKELPLGDYVVHQILAAQNITITQDTPVLIAEDQQTVLLSIDNFIQKGKIEIFKTNDNDSPLSGAVFTVRAAEDISSIDGKIEYTKGHLLATITTDKKGLASTDWLYPGKYFIEEVKAPEGYKLPKNPVTPLTLVADNQNDQTFSKKLTFKNQAEEEYPLTGDINTAAEMRKLAITLLLSLIGLVLMAYQIRQQNKTLH